VVSEAGAVREALDAHPADLAPCHCDRREAHVDRRLGVLGHE
jgi:hypothetical protein